ncbi:MAG TPA: Hsp70 family protein [Micropepsaceae bacterium]|nr:Hsp70 family protein [Micropepsaceae bacterium]
MHAAGLDFGTSNSAIGVIRDGAPVLAPIDGGSAMMPSAIFFDFEEERPSFGREAINAYVSGHDGRLMRSLKSILGSRLVKEDTFLRTRRVPFTTILGLVIGEMKKRAEEFLGAPIEGVVHGRPVHFVDGDAAADRFAEDTLTQVAEDAGFAHVTFAYEPIAAARAYERTIAREETALIADIGGGTSDFSVVRLSPERRDQAERASDILATGGLRLGGTDFDRLLSLDAVMPVFGLGASLKSKRLPMPSILYAELAHWPSINNLYNARTLREVRELDADCREPQKSRRLLQVIEKRLGHRVAMEVEGAKIRLTERESDAVDLSLVEAGLSAPVTRSAFDAAIAEELSRMAHCVRETLSKAGVNAAGQKTLRLNSQKVDTIFVTGGSGLVPAVRQLLAALLPHAVLRSGDDFLSVAKGLTEEARIRFG